MFIKPPILKLGRRDTGRENQAWCDSDRRSALDQEADCGSIGRGARERNSSLRSETGERQTCGWRPHGPERILDMQRYLIFAFLMACSAAAHAATVYDLKNDWSDNANPNGTWQYRAGTTALVHAPDWTGAQLGYSQQVWTITSTPSPNALCPAVFKATSTRAGDDYSLGDIVIHSNSPTCGNDT